MARTKKVLTEDSLLIAYNIKEARIKKYDTIFDAAASLKVEKGLWRRWENAAVTPQKSMMQRVAKHLGVAVSAFHQKPDDWESIKAEFLMQLIGKTKVKKEYYQPLYQSFKNAGHGSGDSEQSISPFENAQRHMKDKQGNAELLSIFLQITRLITDARNKAHEADQETYDMHMRTIADMAKLSLITSK